MARAVLLPCSGPWENFTSAVASVNGFYFTGMFTDYQMDNGTLTGYGVRGQYIINHVYEQNKAGVWLPLFTVCKGFNMLMFFLSGVPHWRDLIRDDIRSSDQPAPIYFNSNKNFKSTTFYKTAASTNSSGLLTINANLYNRHNYGILPNNYSSNENLTNLFGAYIATTIDEAGVEFVSVVESLNYPIYGAATHPEKVIYEWRTNIKAPHTDDSLQANLWFSKLAVNDARRNSRAFASKSEESSYLSYFNQIGETGSYAGGEFRECYFTVKKSQTSPDTSQDSGNSNDDNNVKLKEGEFAGVVISTFIFGTILGAVLSNVFPLIFPRNTESLIKRSDITSNI
jgi:gamma-glutamyl hydrolase